MIALASIFAALVLTGALVLLLGAAFTRQVASRVMQGLPARGQFVQTSAGLIHVVEQGEGPPIILIHGLGGQIGNFSYGVIERLSEHYRVIAMDRLGAGHSQPMPINFTGVFRHAAVIAEVMTALDVGPALIVGHSLGGAVALALTLNHPTLVRGLSLISPLTAIQLEPPAPFRGLKIRGAWRRRLAGHTLAIPLVILRRDATLGALFGPEPVPTDYSTRGLGALSLRPAAFIGASTDMVHANDDIPRLSARLGDITVPVRVLFARQDQILDPEIHGRGLVESIPHSRLTLVDGGHMIPVTAPDCVAFFIREAAKDVFAT
jgi:pimeloyl-ACP methyl ester carboxylesterase